MTQRVTLFVAFCISTAIVFSVGCGGTNVANHSTAKTADRESGSSGTVSTETNSVPTTKTTNLTSPAAMTNNLPSADATAEEVCQKFMNLMQSGNRIGAENLLTTTALTVTTRAGLQLEPMGGPTAVYKVRNVRYATTKQKLAQVECSVIDTVDGEEYEMNVTWLVRKQSPGWRISGVMLELEPGQVPDLLSFENIQDVNRIKRLAGEEVIESADPTRQADASTSNIK
jgi:hypothetical protein